MIASPDCLSSSHTAAAAKDSSRLSALRQETLHDAGLVRRFNAGDDSAFVEIMARHRDQMFSIAYTMLKNRADAEEIEQDTFVRAHRALSKFRGDSSLATWLHRIALNLARNRYWYFFRRRRQSTISLDSAYGEGSQSTYSDLLASDAAGPTREAVSNEFAHLVKTCMDQLGPRPRQILNLRGSQDRSYDEIARELGVNVGTVKSRLARARESLRALLADACPEFGEKAQPAAWFETNRPVGRIEILRA